MKWRVWLSWSIGGALVLCALVAVVECQRMKYEALVTPSPGQYSTVEFRELDLEHSLPGSPHWVGVGLSGADVKHASVSPERDSLHWRVSVDFTSDGGKKLAALTKNLVGKQIGIFVDGEPPELDASGKPVPLRSYRGITVREPIYGGNCEITGLFTKDQAIALARRINAGVGSR